MLLFLIITNRKGIFMESRLTKELLKTAILPIFFIFIFIQACGPTPASALTDTTKTPISGNRISSSLKSEPIFGTTTVLTISGISPISATVSFGNNADVTLTNISGDFGNYTYGNSEMTLSVRIADSGSVTVNLMRLKAPFLLLENIACSSAN